MTLRSFRNLGLCFLLLATALPAMADFTQPGAAEDLTPPAMLDGGNPAGKGTIGIVCHGADGYIRAVQPVDQADIQNEGSEFVLQKVRGQLLKQLPLNVAQEMTCGYQTLDVDLMLNFTQYGPIIQPTDY